MIWGGDLNNRAPKMRDSFSNFMKQINFSIMKNSSKGLLEILHLVAIITITLISGHHAFNHKHLLLVLVTNTTMNQQYHFHKFYFKYIFHIS